MIMNYITGNHCSEIQYFITQKKMASLVLNTFYTLVEDTQQAHT